MIFILTPARIPVLVRTLRDWVRVLERHLRLSVLRNQVPDLAQDVDVAHDSHHLP